MNRETSLKNLPEICFLMVIATCASTGRTVYGDLYDVSVAASSTQATNPNPADGAVIMGDVYGSNIWTRLVFYPGSTAVKHTAYFSDDYEDVANRIEDANLGEPPYANVPGWEYTYLVGNPAVGPADETLVQETVYYWCVDETDAEGNTFLGDIWRFGLMGLKAFAPSPPNEGKLVKTDLLLSWWPGSTVDEHDVYIGIEFNDVNDALYDYYDPPPEFIGTVSDLNIFITGLAFSTKYYWRVDEVFGRTPPPYPAGTYYKGDVWCFTTEPGPIHVDIDATGANNGKSWSDAYNFLQDALAEAKYSKEPVEILVAQGVYKPDRGRGQTAGDRMATFQLINGAEIKGGYAGFGEPNPNERDIEGYKTILSGDLAGNDVNVNDPCDLLDEPTRSENSYHVVSITNCDHTTILEGFTINGGNASSTYPNDLSFGGGIYNYQSSATLVDCTFSGNSAGWNGGGIWSFGEFICSPLLGDLNEDCVVDWEDVRAFCLDWLEPACLVPGCNADLDGVDGVNMSDLALLASNWYVEREQPSTRNPTVTNCTFSDNLAGWYGGGMYNENGSNPTVTNCAFNRNSSDWRGGGMVNVYSSPTITHCTFSGNRGSLSGGGGMYNYQGNPIVTQCTFIGNSSGDGGGMWNYQSSPTVTNCTFSDNSTLVGGGMVNDYNSNPTVTDCTFINNTASYNGAGMTNCLSSPTVTNCNFIGNTAVYGGGMANYEGGSPIVTNCIFRGNLALDSPSVSGGWGGGILNYLCSPKLTNIAFSGNSANYGGGIYSWCSSTQTVTNCIFTGNSASFDGGGLYNYYDSISTVINCTFIGNSAGFDGGGLYNDFNSTSTLTNNILWGNTSGNLGPQVALGSLHVPTTVNISYCDIQGGKTTVYDPCEMLVWEEGNIDADPCFVDSNDPDGADDIFITGDDGLRLIGWRTSFGPCIDAGNNTAVTESNDIIGKSRILDGDGNTTATVDMGAYEFTNMDTDGDGMPDWWEVTYGLDANSATGADGTDGDCDTDGWRNIVEYLLRTEPNNSSSDGEDRLPMGWTTMEIEAKWIISASTFNSLQSDFSDGSTYTVNGTSYEMSWKWGGDQKLYWDLYYDNSGDVLSNGLHCLRKRRRLSSPYHDPTDRDFQRVQYKSDPYRFGAVWMRQEYRDDDLSDANAANIVEGDSTTWDVNPEFYNTVDAVLADHPGFDESTLDDFLQIVDYRYKIDFKKSNVDYFTMSLDNATSTYSGGSPEQFYELELELIPMPHTVSQVDELFRILADLEADYTLIPSTSSKGGLEVPESF